MPTQHVYNVAWICPLEVEFNAAKASLDEEYSANDYKTVPNDNNSYVFGTINNHNIIIARPADGRFGDRIAAKVALNAVRSFRDIRLLFFVGINEDLQLTEPYKKRVRDIRLGDVVISVASNAIGGQTIVPKTSAEIEQAQLSAIRELDRPTLLSRWTAILESCLVLQEKENTLDEDIAIIMTRDRKDRAIDQHHEGITDHVCKPAYKRGTWDETFSGSERCNQKTHTGYREFLSKNDKDNIKIHLGFFSSGNQAMKDSRTQDILVGEDGDLITKIPCLIIRGVCDYANTRKDKAWHDYVAVVAATRTKKLLDTLDPKMITEDNRLGEVERLEEQVESYDTVMSAGVPSVKSDSDIKQIDLLPRAGVGVDVQGGSHGNPVQAAVYTGHESIAQSPIEARTDLNIELRTAGEPSKTIMADAMICLGLHHYKQNKLIEAEKAYVWALQCYEKALGRQHDSTLMELNNLGILYKSQGKLAEAEQMYDRGLQGYEAPGHIKVRRLEMFNNLGSLYRKQGRLMDSERMYRQALQGYEEILGHKHISTLEVATNLGSLYSTRGMLDAAEELYMKVLQGYEETDQPKHTSLLNIVNNLGILYHKQGKLAQAEQMLLRALRGKEEALGQNHTSTLNTVHNLGLIFSEQQRSFMAEHMLLRALHGYEEALGTEAVNTYIPALNVMWAIGDLYFKDRPRDAKDAYTKAMSGFRANQGPSSETCIKIQNQLDLLALPNTIIKTEE